MVTLLKKKKLEANIEIRRSRLLEFRDTFHDFFVTDQSIFSSGPFESFHELPLSSILALNMASKSC